MDITKKKNEKVDVYYERLSRNEYQLKSTYQSIKSDNIEHLLTKIGRFTPDICDVVWCLLNNEFPSLFPKAENFTLADGASVAHIGGYVGILMRGGNRLDREGRDYWIKPLREIGAIEEVTYQNGEFLAGHIKAKSPNSSYRLSRSFITLLQQVGTPNFEKKLNEWISEESINTRLSIHLEAAKENKMNQSDSSHKQLIYDSVNIYSKHFLTGYIPVFVDAEDGDRITEEEMLLLDKYQISFGRLDDVWPDVILYNEELDSLWFIEAVTSDGEVDGHKMQGLHRICKHSEKTFGGATTTYLDWKKFAQRQKKENNLALESYVWIKESPEKQLKVK